MSMTFQIKSNQTIPSIFWVHVVRALDQLGASKIDVHLEQDLCYRRSGSPCLPVFLHAQIQFNDDNYYFTNHKISVAVRQKKKGGKETKGKK